MKTHTNIQVFPSGRVAVSTWDDKGNKIDEPSEYRDWWQLLERRKPFTQPGPLKISPMALTVDVMAWQRESDAFGKRTKGEG